jgi:hypothetical protein
MRIFYCGRAGLGGKFTSQRKDQVLGWNHSNFAKRRQDLCGICSGVQGRTELKNKVFGIDILYYSKPSKIVFTLAEKLFRQAYIIGLDNYCISPELFDLLNELETDAVGTVKSDRKDFLETLWE